MYARDLSWLKILSWFLRPFNDVNSRHSSWGENIASLDGIRGIAVLLVLTSHTSAFGMTGQGSLGVLLFYVLSGFVLTLPFTNAPGHLITPSGLMKFFINRFLRIFPSFFIAVILTAALLHKDPEWIVGNISFYKGWSHFWSVAQEARYYALFPIVIGLMGLLHKQSMRILALTAMTWLSWKYRSCHLIDMMDGRFISFYLWFFLGGVLACFIYATPCMVKLVSHRFIKSSLGIISALTLLFLPLSSNHMITRFWRTLFPGLPEDLSLNGWHIPEVWLFLFVLLLLGVTLCKDCMASRFLRTWPLRHLGLLSYSLYLFHHLFHIILVSEHRTNEKLFVAVFSATYVFSLLSYSFIEKPFLILKEKLNTKRIIKFLTIDPR